MASRYACISLVLLMGISVSTTKTATVVAATTGIQEQRINHTGDEIDYGQQPTHPRRKLPLNSLSSSSSLSTSFGLQFDGFGKTSSIPARLRKARRTTNLAYHNNAYQDDETMESILIDDTKQTLLGQNWGAVAASYHGSRLHTDGLIIKVEDKGVFTSTSSLFHFTNRMDGVNQHVRSQQLEAMFEAEQMQSLLVMSSMSMAIPPVRYLLCFSYFSQVVSIHSYHPCIQLLIDMASVTTVTSYTISHAVSSHSTFHR
jgi:hypothetical protein